MFSTVDVVLVLIPRENHVNLQKCRHIVPTAIATVLREGGLSRNPVDKLLIPPSWWDRPPGRSTCGCTLTRWTGREAGPTGLLSAKFPTLVTGRLGPPTLKSAVLYAWSAASDSCTVGVLPPSISFRRIWWNFVRIVLAFARAAIRSVNAPNIAPEMA